MYTGQSIEVVSEEKPSHFILKTEEEFDIHFTYRYGILLVEVNEELLHKVKLTKDYTHSMMSVSDIIEYCEEYLPEEMIDFGIAKTTIKIK